MANRVLIIGWDGADWTILRPLLDSGELPNLEALIEKSAYGDCLSTVPSHSWCAWPSFMTGMNPAGHGVFDILEHKPGVSRRLPVTYRSIRAKTIFDDLTAAGRTTIAANIPLTFPPPEVSGKVVAGGVVPASRTYTHPAGLQQELDRAAPFPVNGMSWTTFRNRPEALLEEAAEITAKRQLAFEYLLDTTDWDLGVLVYVATDRIQHCLMEYVSSEHPSYQDLKDTPVAKQTRALYQQLDEGLGRLLERTNNDDLVMFMSDHGHQPCTRCCTLDRILHHLGYLEFGRGSFAVNLLRSGPGRRVARRIYDVLKLHGKVAIPGSSIDWSRSVAYTSVVSTGEGVSLNLQGREPSGTVPARDFERVRDEVAAALAEFRDAETGERPIAGIYRKEEILSGPFLDAAPDLLLVAAPLHSLTHARAMVEDADWVSGDHRLEGVLVAAGPEVTPGELRESARLIDLAPTALAALDVPTSVRRDGAVLRSLAGEGAELRTIGAGDAAATAPSDTGLTSQEEDEIEDHLRGLGYVE